MAQAIHTAHKAPSAPWARRMPPMILSCTDIVDPLSIHSLNAFRIAFFWSSLLLTIRLQRWLDQASRPCIFPLKADA